jgi:hypothetical protein
MKPFFLIVCYLLLTFNSTFLVAQNNSVNYFNKTYGGNDTLNILAQAVLPVDSGYLVFGNYATNTIEAGLGMTILDKKGDFLSFKSIEQSPTFINLGINGGNQILKGNNNFSLLYIKEQDINIAKFNYNGDTLWHHSYSKMGFQSGIQTVKTHDAGYLIAGMEGNVAGDTVRGYLLKVDSLGNFEWDRQYEKGNDSRFFSIQPTPWDGGYILGGMGYSPTTGYDMWVVKIDSLGDTLWTRSYGGVYWDCGAQVVPINNATPAYIINGCWRDTSDPWTAKLYIAKLDSVGGIIWQKKHNNYNYFASIQTPLIVRDDGSIIGVSSLLQNDYWHTNPVIVSFKSNGDIDWLKPVTINPEKDCYIKDMRPTDDGGYVLAGYQYDTPQTAWVLKIDSLGNTCSFVGCDSTVYVGVGETPILPLGDSVFRVYPNPAQDHLVIENNSLEKSATFVLYDVLGRQVLSVVSHHQSVVPVEHLPSGVYLYQFLNPQNQIVAYGKVSVVR